MILCGGEWRGSEIFGGSLNAKAKLGTPVFDASYGLPFLRVVVILQSKQH